MGFHIFGNRLAFSILIFHIYLNCYCLCLPLSTMEDSVPIPKTTDRMVVHQVGVWEWHLWLWVCDYAASVTYLLP